MLFSYLHFGEKMNRRKWLGLLLGACGMVPVFMQKEGVEELWKVTSWLSWPELSMIAAVASACYGWVLLRLFVKEQQVPPLVANGISMLVGGILATCHSLAFESWTPLPIAAQDAGQFLTGLGTIICISNLIGYNLYGILVKRVTATFLSFVGLLSPIFASISGALILGEPISWTILLSTGILLSGLWLVYSAELRQGYIMKSSSSAKQTNC